MNIYNLASSWHYMGGNISSRVLEPASADQFKHQKIVLTCSKTDQSKIELVGIYQSKTVFIKKLLENMGGNITSKIEH